MDEAAWNRRRGGRDATLEATQGQIAIQMPPESGGICGEIDLKFAPGLPPEWQRLAAGSRRMQGSICYGTYKSVKAPASGFRQDSPIFGEAAWSG